MGSLNYERTYSQLIQLDSFEERFEYLALHGRVGSETFGFDRYLNQKFYASKEWKDFRRDVIVRDNGCDLGVDDGLHDILHRPIIHHINPISPKDLRENNIDIILDMNNVILCSHATHEAIHYGDRSLLYSLTERKPNDTIPWR